MANMWKKMAAMESENGSPVLIKTGCGSNGRMEPEKPVGIDMTSGSPIVVHEGETLLDSERGRIVIPANGLITPQNSTEQNQLEQLNKVLPGMQEGGLIPNNRVEQIQPTRFSNNRFDSISPIAPPRQPVQAPMQPAQPIQPVQAITPVQQTPQGISQQIGSIIPPIAPPQVPRPVKEQGILSSDDLYSQLAQRSTQALATRQAAEQAAQQQQMAQLELSSAAQSGLGKDLERQQSLQQNQLLADLTSQETDARARNAANSISTLFAAGGYDNIIRGGELFEDLYGTKLDTERLINNSIMSDLAEITAQPGMNTETALQEAINRGILEEYGLDENRAREIIKNNILGTNPIYRAQQENQELLSQGIIDQDQFDHLMALEEFALTNPTGIDVRDSYIVKDKNGNQIQNFLSENEAQIFVDKNPGSTFEFKKDGYIGLADQYQEFTGLGEGEFLTDNGGIFKIVDGQKVKATINSDNPVALENTQIIDFLESKDAMSDQEQDIYDEIVSIQTKHYLNKPDDIIGANVSDAVMNNIVDKSKKLDYGDPYRERSGKNRWLIDAFEGLPENTMVNINGKLYLFENSKITDGGGVRDRHKVYTFKDTDTGETINVPAHFSGRNKHAKKKIDDLFN